MYDPTLGRWLTPDPAGFDAGDDNLYRFVGNEPVGSSDPSGLVRYGTTAGDDGRPRPTAQVPRTPDTQLEDLVAALRRDFDLGRVTRDNIRIVSDGGPNAANYNCHAYARGETRIGISYDGWTERRLDEDFKRDGFTRTADPAPKKGVVKVALYGSEKMFNAGGEKKYLVNHSAVSVDGGEYRSKIGSRPIVVEHKLDVLAAGKEGQGYGSLLFFYEKPVPALAPEPREARPCGCP